MRRLSNSSLPAAVSKNHWPLRFTMGTGNGQELSPTSSTHLESVSCTSRCCWLTAALNALSSLVACTRSGFSMSAAAGPNITRRALVSSAPAAATSAVTAASGVANVLPISDALAVIAAPRANVSAARFQLRMDRENRFNEFMKQVFEIFISIKKIEVESFAGEFIGDRRRRDRHH